MDPALLCRLQYTAPMSYTPTKTTAHLHNQNTMELRSYIVYIENDANRKTKASGKKEGLI